MKKTFFLISALGLLTAAGNVYGSDERVWNEIYWNDETSFPAEQTLGKDDKLIIDLGSTAQNQEVDLGDSTITNNVVTIIDSSAVINKDADNDEASLLTYTYGALHLTDDTNVKFSNSGNIDWSYVGTLSLGADARLNLAGRNFAVTGVPYVSLGAGAEIELSTITTADPNTGEQTKHRGLLSFGLSNEPYWDALTVKGAYGETGYVRNTSDSVATLGTETAANVEYVNVVLTVQGNETTTPIAAKLGNSAIVNTSTNNGTVIVSGGIAEGHTTAATQIHTGGPFGNEGGDITLLNLGVNDQKVDALYIANHKVTAKQGDESSKAAVVKINAYDASKNLDVDQEGLFVWGANSALDADLVLGTGSTDDAVFFQNYSALDMCGNDVILDSGILITDPGNYGEDIGTEVLLFTNVDSLTLGNIKYDDKYFDYHAEIEAGRFFTSTRFASDGIPYGLTSVDMPTDNGDGTRTGWFIEYRETSTGIGNVYLVLNTVPEPTTATLSLLALAGLAARRRRK